MTRSCVIEGSRKRWETVFVYPCRLFRAQTCSLGCVAAFRMTARDEFPPRFDIASRDANASVVESAPFTAPMTRWIVFEGPPTRQEALNSCSARRGGQSEAFWTSLHFRLAFGPSKRTDCEEGERGGHIRPTTPSPSAQIEEKGDLSPHERNSNSPATPSEEGDLSSDEGPSDLYDTSDREHWEQSRHDKHFDACSRSIGATRIKQEDDDVFAFPSGGRCLILLCRGCQMKASGELNNLFTEMLPPPAQKRRRSSRIWPIDEVAEEDLAATERPPEPTDPTHSHLSTTCAGDDSYDCVSRSYVGETASGCGGIGAPPEFPFRRRDLVPLSEMHVRQLSGQPVSVLACVWAINHYDANGTKRHEWSLLDSSGHNHPFIIWDSDYGQPARSVRLGDVVYLGCELPYPPHRERSFLVDRAVMTDLTSSAALAIGSWQGKLQLKYRRKATKVQVCWRMTLLDPEDRRYRFHRDWGKEIPEAAAVLREVDGPAARIS